MRKLLPALTSFGLFFTFTVPARAQLAAGEPTTDLEATNWATNLGSQPTDIAFHPDGRAVIVRKGGEIIVRTAAGTLVRNAGRVMSVDTASEKGVLGIVADPNAAQNDRFFLYASTQGTPVTDRHKIFTATLGDNNMVTVDQANPIVSMGLEGPANHDGGGLMIHKNQLYISVGDTGDNNANPPLNKYGSCLNKANGKILRVNLDGSIPADNPLANVAQATSCDTTRGAFGMAPPDRRIYAWGFRNPYRFWVDPMTDLLWVGDVGEATSEEISIVALGDHLGYPFVEGTRDWSATQNFTPRDCNAMTPARACKAPAFAYANKAAGGDGASDCVIGGLILDACGWSNTWKARYVFGDHGSGKAWTLDVANDRRGVVANSQKDFGTFPGLAGFRMDPWGGLYVIQESVGAIIKVTPKNQPANCAAGGAGGSGGGGSGGAGGAGGGGGGSAGGAGGSGGGGSSGAGGAGGSGGGAGGGGSAGGTTDDSGGGCGCRVGGASTGGAAALLAAFGLIAALRRRRRRP